DRGLQSADVALEFSLLDRDRDHVVGERRARPIGQERVEQAEAVLAARHAHGHAVAGTQHREATHRAPDQLEDSRRRVHQVLYLSGALSGMATTLMSYFTAVDISCALYMKPPSPQMATTGRSGCATLAPSAVGYSKPRFPEYDEFRYVRGRKTGQNGRE